MQTVEAQDAQRLADLAEQIRAADVAMASISREIMQYRAAHGLSFTRDAGRFTRLSDTRLQALERQLGQAQRKFHGLLAEHAALLKSAHGGK